MGRRRIRRERKLRRMPDRRRQDRLEFSEILKRVSHQKVHNYFCVACSLMGTTPAVIRGETFEVAHWLYSHKVLIPAKATPFNRFKKTAINGDIYFDGDMYIEKLKVWKTYMSRKIASVGLNILVHKRKISLEPTSKQ